MGGGMLDKLIAGEAFWINRLHYSGLFTFDNRGV